MKVFDYFYENYFLPLVENITDTGQTIWEVFLTVVEWLVVVVFFITIPLWLIPYSVVKKKREITANRR